jgi:sugar lactone lactonase YvrE
MKIEVVQEVRAVLGESPVWDAARGCLHWLDLAAHRYHRLEPSDGATREIELTAEPGSIALTQTGSMVGAFADGFWRFDPDTGARAAMTNPEAGLPDNRFNDGKAGPDGAFWAGSLNRDYAKPTGTLWRLAPDELCAAVMGDIHVSNGPAWSPAGDRFYFSDSVRGVTWVFPFNPESGELGESRVFADRDAAPGYPDGAAMDAKGGLWSARWQGGCVVRFTPQGVVDRMVQLPVSQVTSCAFGGPGLATLFVTTASIGLEAAQLDAQPLSGSVFAFDPGVSGAPVDVYAG